MTWTYDPSIPEDLDAVRLNLGDTDEDNPLFSNEEITYRLGQETNVLLATAHLAENAAAKFAREVDKSSDGDSISSSQRFKHFKELAEQLRDEALRSGQEAAAGPYVGGISYTDKEGYELDEDRIPTAVRIGIHNNPSAAHDWRTRQVDQ